MAPDTNIFVRRLLAGLLFFLGLLWAFCAVVAMADLFDGPKAHFAAIGFWTIGSAIWIGWGLVAFSRLKRTWELLLWLFATIFHATLLLAISGLGGQWNGPAILIPLWWTGAFLV